MRVDDVVGNVWGALPWSAPRAAPQARGLHSLVHVQLNVSAFNGIGAIFRGYLLVFRGCQGVVGGVQGVFCVRNGS